MVCPNMGPVGVVRTVAGSSATMGRPHPSHVIKPSVLSMNAAKSARVDARSAYSDMIVWCWLRIRKMQNTNVADDAIWTTMTNAYGIR